MNNKTNSLNDINRVCIVTVRPKKKKIKEEEKKEKKRKHNSNPELSDLVNSFKEYLLEVLYLTQPTEARF